MFKSMFSPAQSNEDAQRDEALKSLILTEDLNNFLYKLSTVMGFNKDSVHVVDTGTCRQYRFYHREEAGMLLRYIQQDRFRDVPDIGKAKVSQLRAQVRAQAELGKVHPYTVRLMPYQIAAINGITTQQAQEAAFCDAGMDLAINQSSLHCPNAYIAASSATSLSARLDRGSSAQLGSSIPRLQG